MENYNGWTNWDTWNANLWLNNDENVHINLQDCQNSNDVKVLFIDTFDTGSNEHDGIDYGRVNWYEILDAIEG